MRVNVFRGGIRRIRFASEVFSADARFDHLEILRKEKRLADKVHGREAEASDYRVRRKEGVKGGVT